MVERPFLVAKEYWKHAVDRFPELLSNGFIKLDAMKLEDKTTIVESIKDEMMGANFKESGKAHQKFLSDIGIFEHFQQSLYQLATEHLNYTGTIENQYHIARCVSNLNHSEAYRSHFDSHLFTLVIPLEIPAEPRIERSGALYFLSKARPLARNEFENFLGKVYFKKFSGMQGYRRLAKQSGFETYDFADGRPLLFCGSTTLHGNFPVARDLNCDRLTLLAHFFDPAPAFGVGNLFRFIRAR